MFRTMVLAGLTKTVAPRSRMPDYLGTSASCEQPRGPMPLHGNKSHWLLTIGKDSSAPPCGDKPSPVTQSD